MATWYINADTGDNSTGDGSSGSPWETLAHANSEASTNDTIHFQEATAQYACDNMILTEGVNLVATNYGDATLAGGAYRFEGQGSHSITNLIFDNFSTQNSSLNCWGTLVGNRTDTTTVYTITGCKWHSMSTSDSYAASGPFTSNIKVNSTGYYMTTGKLTYNCTRCLFDLDSGNGCLVGASQNQSGYTITFDYCTIYANGSIDPLFEYGGNRQTSITFKNSIVYAPSAINFYDSSISMTKSATYTCFYNITNAPSGTGVITSDPLFVDIAAKNYELRPSSPCINTGTLT